MISSDMPFTTLPSVQTALSQQGGRRHFILVIKGDGGGREGDGGGREGDGGTRGGGEAKTEEEIQERATGVVRRAAAATAAAGRGSRKWTR